MKTLVFSISFPKSSHPSLSSKPLHRSPDPQLMSPPDTQTTHKTLEMYKYYFFPSSLEIIIINYTYFTV